LPLRFEHCGRTGLEDRDSTGRRWHLTRRTVDGSRTTRYTVLYVYNNIFDALVASCQPCSLSNILSSCACLAGPLLMELASPRCSALLSPREGKGEDMLCNRQGWIGACAGLGHGPTRSGLHAIPIILEV